MMKPTEEAPLQAGGGSPIRSSMYKMHPHFVYPKRNGVLNIPKSVRSELRGIRPDLGMKRLMRAVKRPKISRHEIIADVIFLFIGMLVSFMAIYIFDIHWSFYPGNSALPPNRYIFQGPEPYYIGVPLGGIIGFFVIKLLFYAFMEEEEAVKEEEWHGFKKRRKST